jgi:outer membrane protein insertion porin family
MLQRIIIQRTFAFILSLLIISSLCAPAQNISNLKFTLANVEYKGLSLFTPGEINSIIDFKIGNSITFSDLEKALSTLHEWGYFKSAHYEYKYSGVRLSVVFTMEEISNLADCAFDNFVGFTDKELLEEIQKKIPSFKGKVPSTGAVLQNISTILENSLNRSGNTYRIKFTPFFDASSTTAPRLISFFIENNKASAICKATTEIDASELSPILEKTASKLIHTPYSKSQIKIFSKLNIAPTARNYGYWNLDISNITSEKTSFPDCPSGVTVKIFFRSGGVYSLGSIYWSGNAAVTASELDLLLGVKRGDIASQEKIEAGLIKAGSAYLKNGFLDYYFPQVQSTMDEWNRRVNYRVSIMERNQYRMGTFISSPLFNNLPFDALSKQWKLKAGDIFDELYFNEFKEQSFKPWSQTYARNLNLTLNIAKTNGIANVILSASPPSPPSFQTTPKGF